MTGKNKPRTVKPPDLPELEDLSREGLPGGVVRDRERYDTLLLSHSDLSGQKASFASFEETVFSHASLTDAEFTGLHLVDTRLENCDLANTGFYKVSLQRVEIIDCRMVGLKAVECEFQDVLFRRCKGGFALFTPSTFKSVRFEECDLTDADFSGADLSGVVFSNCDLSRCDMRRTTLAGTDLRGSKIGELLVDVEDLKGVIVDPTQAVEFVRLLGLTVKAEHE